MKHISVLVPRGNFVINTIECAYSVFNAVNNFLQNENKPLLFKVQLVGLLIENRVNGFYSVSSEMIIQDIVKTNLIIIPALSGDIEKGIADNKEFIPWIIDQHKNGAEVASLCMGSFLLASTGLLKGRQCSTHWVAENSFRKIFPNVNLVTEKIITDENGIYSSGAAYSSMNLILYLVQKYAGSNMAILCAKLFAIEMKKNNQSVFVIFKGQKEHDDEIVKKVQEFIENNFQDKITIDQLASMFELSRRNLERRFRKATFNTIVNYIQRIKIEVAKMKLESSLENISSVMIHAGYSDPKSFHSTFKKITGLTPKNYRARYSLKL